MKPGIIIGHAFAAALTLAISGPGLAQTEADNETDDAEEVIEEVLVTGSRIRRDSFNVSTPLVSIDSLAITDAGLGSLAEILIDEVPALYESTSNMNSQSQIGNTGVTSMNLRRLGSNRTLVLIDGRRTVQNAYGGRFVSLNTIPAGMVERVEIVTGGSSATYGSDAIAGVVNIITQQSKEGFGFSTRGGVTDEGGGEEFTFNADFGTSFADGRGYFFIAGSYDQEEGIDHADRARAQLEADFDYNTTLLCNEMQTATYDPVAETHDQCMRDISSPLDWRDRSDGTAGGVFSEGATDFPNGESNPLVAWWYDDNNVLSSDWNEERDGLFSRQWDVVKVPNEQTTAAFKVEYDLSDTTTAYYQMQYSQNTSFNFKSPEDDNESSDVATIDRVTGEPGEVRPGHIADDNPFLLESEIANDPNFPANWNGDWDRRFFEVGNITTDNTRTTWRSWAGLRGSIFKDEWDWDVSVGYGKFEQYQVRSNELDVVKEAQALDSEFAADGVTIQCADPVARAEGCVPLNIFGVGSITPEMADWIRVNPIINPTIKQINVLGFISGELFDMPAGPVGAVFGVEYNKDDMDLQVSDGPRFGGITFNLVPNIAGSIDVTELFTEFSFPLAERLTADVSMRVGNYSPKNIGTVFSYTTGLIWEPVDGYILRANIARAQRAPDITELLSPRRGDFDSFDDICADVSLTSTEVGHDNCRLDPDIAAVIADGTVFDDDNNGYSPSAGNTELFEETADTYTIGFSIAPSFLEGFRLAVDYYDITIEDAIISVENIEILKQCYASSVTLGGPNEFCDDITRDSEGQLIEVLQRQLNLNEQSTSGFDVALDYVFGVGRGDLQIAANYTHIISHEVLFDGVDGVVVEDFNNQLDFGIFEDVAVASIAWTHNDWRVRWRTSYKGPITDHNDRVDGYLARFATNDERCAAGDSRCVSNPEVPAFLYYPSYTRHDLSIAKDMELKSGGNLGMSAGVRNMFDEDIFVPRTGDAFEGGIANYDSKFGGGVGRYYYAGFSMHFD
jgi:outer membrane receptor protein involved in Fe transport